MDGTVTHFEIPADDVKRARTFYSKMFDWELSPFYGSDYLYITPRDGKDSDLTAGKGQWRP